MSQKIIQGAIASLIAAGLAQVSEAHLEHMGTIEGMEKCYGVAKAHQNACGNELHGCAGESKVDAANNEWLLLPTGTCEKLVNGKLVPKQSSE